MLQQDKPDDYVIATGEMHTVREFVEESTRLIGINIEWRGSGIEEKGIDKKSGKTIIQIDPRYFRPAEVDLLIGESKAKLVKKWDGSQKFLLKNWLR